jgi:hypothetical protein
VARAQTYRIVAHLPDAIWTEPTCAGCDCELSEYGVLLARCPVCQLVFCAIDMWRHGCSAERIREASERGQARWRLEMAFHHILSMGRSWTVAKQQRLLDTGT